MGAYPSAPWRLTGRVAVAGSVRTGAMLLLGLYGEGSTLRYGEAAGMVGPVVRWLYVDDEPSLAGGREIWGLPKERMAALAQRTAHRGRGAGRSRRAARERVLGGTENTFAVPRPAAVSWDQSGAARVPGRGTAGRSRQDRRRRARRVGFSQLGLAGRRFGLVGRLDVMATHPPSFADGRVSGSPPAPTSAAAAPRPRGLLWIEAVAATRAVAVRCRRRLESVVRRGDGPAGRRDRP
jgi:hypothetical protein